MTSADIAAQTVTIVHSTLLMEQPNFGAPPLELLWRGDHVISRGYIEGFLHAQRGQGQAGYVPAAICAPRAVEAPADIHPTTQVRQVVALYSHPVPGRQSTPDLSQALAPLLIYPDESLLVLGHDDRFTLVQRSNGQLGYIPTGLCDAGATLIGPLKVGPVDLGWMLAGGGWALLNWLAVMALLQPLFPEPSLRPYAGLAVVLGVAVTLWLGSPRRRVARSFAAGFLVGYALAHLLSCETLTLWR
jgi:hypothetical protein